MGYHLTLRICVAQHLKVPLTYKKSGFQNENSLTANVLEGEQIFPQKGAKFVIDERKNMKLMEQTLKNKLDKYRLLGETLPEEDLADFQYLAFEYGTQKLYFVFHTGVSEKICFMNVIPFVHGTLVVDGTYYYEEMGDYYEQEIRVDFI